MISGHLVEFSELHHHNTLPSCSTSSQSTSIYQQPLLERSPQKAKQTGNNFRQKLKLLLKYIELQGNNQYSTAAKQQRKRPMPIKTKTGEDVKMPRVSAFELCFRQKLKLLLKYIELQGNNQYSTAAKQQRKRPMQIKTKTGEDVKMPRVSAFELWPPVVGGRFAFWTSRGCVWGLKTYYHDNRQLLVWRRRRRAF